MQEEITQQAISLTVEAARLTEPVLQEAAKKLLEKLKDQAVKGIESRGRLTVKEMVASGPTASIDLNKQGFGRFRRIMRDNGVKYAIRQVIGSNPPQYHVLFRAGSKDAMTNALGEFAAVKLNRERKPSALARLHSIMKSLQNVLGKERVRDKEMGLER